MRRILALAVALALVFCGGCGRDIPGAIPEENVPVLPGEQRGETTQSILLSAALEANTPLALALKQLAGEYSRDSGPTGGRVTISVRFKRQSEQELLAELLGNAPAELYMMPLEYVRGLGEEGLLRTLTEAPWQSEDAFLAPATAWCMGQNGLWAAPYLGYAPALLYSPRLLRQAGLVGPPESWNALRADCAQVAAYTQAAGFAGVAYASGDLAELVTQLVYTFGGSLAQPENETGAVPQARQALEFYRELLKNGSTEEYAMNDMDRAVQEFWLGRAAMAVGTPAHALMLEKNGFDPGITPMPGKERQGGARLKGYALAASANAFGESTREADAFLRWLLEPEQIDFFLQTQYEGFHNAAQSPDRDAFLLPLTKAGGTVFYARHPQYMAYRTEMERAALPMTGKKWEQFEENALLPALRRILAEEGNLDEELARVRREKNAIFSN